jgi:hypothetical protein
VQRKLACFGAILLSFCALKKASAEDPNPSKSRPLHVVAQAGFYASLGSPAGYGPTLSLDLLPGSFAGRYGLRGEYRGYHDLSEGSVIVSGIFEAGASRPQLALKLVAEVGMTSDNRPLVGGGVEWSLWAWGPLGVSTLTDLQIIIDGSGTRPALAGTLCLHLGR